jgi:ABC-type transport system substrate-binding protein
MAGHSGNGARRGGTLREGYDYGFSRCDPATGPHVDPAWCAIYETVTVSDADGRLKPMLAGSWRADPDGLAWRLPIPAGITFQSGAACDAEAVAAAFRVHGDPRESPVNAFFWKSVRDVGAADGEVVVRLHHPNVGLPRLLRSWHSAIHNQALRERTPGDEWGFTVADGTGPFRLAVVAADREEVERWDGYRGPRAPWLSNPGPAYLDRIRWVPLFDERERAAALEAGEVDCLQNPSLLDVDRLAANPELEVIEFQQPALVYLALDHEHTGLGFDDLRVRQAISVAIDRDAIVATDLAGHGAPAHGPVPSASPWYAPGVEAFNHFDPRRAIDLLDAAGLEPGADGTRLRFTANVVEDATVRRAAASLQRMLREVGVELELEEIAGFDAFYGSLLEHPAAFVSKWFWPDPVDAIVGFISSWSHAGPNWQRASIPAIDEACLAWQQAADEDAQRSAARDIQVRSAETLPLIPLFFPSMVWAHHRRVHGWQPHGHDLYPLYGDVWIEADG